MQPREHTIEDFAELCASFDCGGASRAGQAHLDDADWHSLRAKLLSVLTDASVPDIAQRFARAYGQARFGQARTVAASIGAAPAEPLFELDGGDTEVDARPPIHDPDQTSNLAFPLAGPAMPFKNAALLPATWYLLHRETPHYSAVPAIVRDLTEETLQLDQTCPPTGSVLPFVASPDAFAGGRLRLQRFDPQTGQRLDPPVWVWMDER
jgi:hypothetical protein